MMCHVNSAVLVFMAYSKHIQAQMSVYSGFPWTAYAVHASVWTDLVSTLLFSYAH